MWSGRKPNVEYFIIFGCIAYVHISDRGRAKLDEKSHKCVFIGVSEESKAYWLYDPNTKKVIVIRDVVFDENVGWNWSDDEGRSDVFTWADIDDDREISDYDEKSTEGDDTEELERNNEILRRETMALHKNMVLRNAVNNTNCSLNMKMEGNA